MARWNPGWSGAARATSARVESRYARAICPSGKTLGACKIPSIPAHKNIPLYRNSELRHSLAIPVLGEGRSYVVTNVDRGAVDAAVSGTRMRDQGEMNLVRSCCVQTDGANALAMLFGRSRVKLRTAKTRGPDRRCYGQALRR
jgi:hypothetical protein